MVFAEIYQCSHPNGTGSSSDLDLAFAMPRNRLHRAVLVSPGSRAFCD